MNTLKQIRAVIQQPVFERFLFLAVILLNLIPVFSVTYFTTLDGPAHLYNARLINTLLLDSSDTLNQFYRMNSEWIPNWTSHFILSFFQLFLPSYLAEKCLLLIYFISVPLTFRGLIKTINPDNSILSFLIFPFTFSSVFSLGFYNFTLAFALLFFGLSYWIKNQEKLTSWKVRIVLFCVFIVCYFTHLFVFIFLLVLLLIQIGYSSFHSGIKNGFKMAMRELLVKSGTLLVISSFPLFLFYIYLTKHPSTNNRVFLTNSELFSWFKNLRPIISVSIEQEEKYTIIISCCLAILLLLALFNRFKQLIKKQANDSFITRLFTQTDGWVLCCVFVFYIYFTLPDSDGVSGVVSIRIALLVYLVVICWIATQKIKKWIVASLVGTILALHFIMTAYYIENAKDLDKLAISSHNAAHYIEPNSVVLPFNFSNNWFLGHFSNYLGADKPMVILENYEAGTGYFPINWNYDRFPNLKLGPHVASEELCFAWGTNAKNESKQIDYVFILGPDIDAPCNKEILQILREDFKLVYKKDECRLYRFKKH